MCLRLLFLLMLLIVNISGLRSSSYLQSTVNDLNTRLGDVSTKRRMDSVRPRITKQSMRKGGPENVPPLSLTKGELAALYEAALSKEQANKNHDKNPIFDHSSSYVLDKPLHDHHDPHDHTNTEEGYYYYYYPLESFMDGHNHHQDDHDPAHALDNHLAQYHSHTHQHNVHISSTKGPIDTDKKKQMEPLFVAVSSFIGMAIMFILSIIFLPKFGVLKSRGSSTGDITSLTDLVFRAIHGDNCSERLACELGKRAKPLRIQNNRFIKLLKRMSPASLGWYVDGMTKYSRKNLTCASIQCIPKNATKQKPTVKK